MGYGSFLAWVARVGWQVVGKQKYLNKVWQEATKGGKVILQTHFPKLLNKAKDYYKGFKTPDLKIVPKTKIVPKKPNPLGDILQGKPHIDKQGRSWGFEKIPAPKGLKKSNVIPFPKKPPGKADGGRIDKALPKRSRDI